MNAGFNYENPEEIWEEMRQVTPDFWGIDYERIEREGGVHWPCPTFDHPGTPFLFAEEFEDKPILGLPPMPPTILFRKFISK